MFNKKKWLMCVMAFINGFAAVHMRSLDRVAAIQQEKTQVNVQFYVDASHDVDRHNFELQPERISDDLINKLVVWQNFTVKSKVTSCFNSGCSVIVDEMTVRPNLFRNKLTSDLKLIPKSNNNIQMGVNLALQRAKENEIENKKIYFVVTVGSGVEQLDEEYMANTAEEITQYNAHVFFVQMTNDEIKPPFADLLESNDRVHFYALKEWHKIYQDIIAFVNS